MASPRFFSPDYGFYKLSGGQHSPDHSFFKLFRNDGVASVFPDYCFYMFSGNRHSPDYGFYNCLGTMVSTGSPDYDLYKLFGIEASPNRCSVWFSPCDPPARPTRSWKPLPPGSATTGNGSEASLGREGAGGFIKFQWMSKDFNGLSTHSGNGDSPDYWF